MKKKLLLTEPYVEATDTSPLNILKDFMEIRVAHNASEEQLVKEVKDATALIVRLARITKRIIDSGENLKVISKTGVGVDNICVEAATKNGIFVCNVPSLNADSVAEHTFGLILALAKNIVEADKRLRTEGWSFRDSLWPRNIELHGKVLGIIGLGAVGSRVATIAKAFRINVLAYDYKRRIEKATKVGAKLVDLDVLLRESDFVTIHCSLKEATKNLIDQNKIKLMKKTAFLINCARGAIVNQEALIDSLRENTIAGAALDTYVDEPINPENPLFKLKNTIVTPHVAGMTYDVRVKSMQILVDDIVRVLKGEVPKNLVNPEVLSQRVRN